MAQVIKSMDATFEAGLEFVHPFTCKQSQDATTKQAYTLKVALGGATLGQLLNSATRTLVVDVQRKIRSKGLKEFPDGTCITMQAANLGTGSMTVATPQVASAMIDAMDPAERKAWLKEKLAQYAEADESEEGE